MHCDVVNVNTLNKVNMGISQCGHIIHTFMGVHGEVGYSIVAMDWPVTGYGYNHMATSYIRLQVHAPCLTVSKLAA